MKIRIIQSPPQILFVGSPDNCENCEEEKRLEDALKGKTAEDKVSLSDASLSRASAVFEAKELDSEEESQQPGPKTNLELSEEERRLLNELRARDAEVRAHEQAHLSAAGPYANGTPTFEFQTGPDGRQYAVGGEVSIDASPVPGDPEATVRKAQTIKRAALAPSDPSAQDRQVAAQAAQLEAQARQEAKAQKAEENKETTETPLEESKEPETKSENSDDFSQGNPFSRRVENRFNPSSITTGNLLNIIS
ncbi:MAG: catalase [Nitrospinae bacterium CG22_combo_CG10-13_8_21_14_all_47_10]|nr:MAG: catalase [Nitrospinae bacterium CG22_combo_CG10-13_8_21_14_all_47_10]